MYDELQQSALVGEIYDAAMVPSSSACVLARIARFVGGPVATLEVEAAAGTCVQNFGVDSHFWQLYLDHDIGVALNTIGRLPADIDEPFAARDVADPELVACRFYREWMQPQR